MSGASHTTREVEEVEVTRLAQAFAAFDQANAKDPNKEEVNGIELARELAYAQRMSAWLQRLYPSASEALKLAARCQHIERWTHPRSDYPAGRIGYLKWRHNLKVYHAMRGGELLRDTGYSEDIISRVESLVRKERMKQDPEVQALEDVVCLVFLAHFFAAFSGNHDRDKIVGIVRKTWGKMSPYARREAQELSFDRNLQSLISEALSEAA